MREALCNAIREELQISRRLICPDLIKNTLNHRTAEYPVKSQSLWGHKEKTAITTTTKTMAKCGHFPQLFLVNL